MREKSNALQRSTNATLRQVKPMFRCMVSLHGEGRKVVIVTVTDMLIQQFGMHRKPSGLIAA
jgi:hypothetical protein